MAHDMVDRSADRLAIAAVIQGRRVGVMIAREFEGESVEACGRNPWFYKWADQIERFRRQRAGLAHRGEVLRPVQADLPAAAANLLVCEHECRRRRHQRSLGPYSRNSTHMPCFAPKTSHQFEIGNGPPAWRTFLAFMLASRQ